MHIVTTGVRGAPSPSANYQFKPYTCGTLSKKHTNLICVTKHNGGVGVGGRDAVLTGEPEGCVRRPLWLSLGLYADVAGHLPLGFCWGSPPDNSCDNSVASSRTVCGAGV